MSASVTVPRIVDSKQPWLGLASYSEADSELFFGREKESSELVRLVRREVLTVLFGPSGTGKTSLLNAGLFPRLRESSFLPIAIRLDHSSDRPDYIGQIRARIVEVLHADATRPIEEQALARQQEDQETLWEYLHRMVFWDWRNNPVTPVLVFDQFEEIFTLGRTRAATEEFLTALADVVENYIPDAVRSRMKARGEVIHFLHDQPKAKVVLSLREDFVWRLDGLRKAMPSVMHNRFTIARMNGEQALRAVQEPGQDIVEGTVAQQIVRFVAAANQSRAAAGGEDILLDSLQVDPALLSVVCRELNARRIEQKKDQITEDLLKQAGTDILSDFYERGFEGLHPAVRVFVEDRLLTASGFRSTVPLEEATQTGIAPDDIHTLVDRRLIRTEEHLGIPHLELTHDLLTKIVQQSRAERQEREQREREGQQRETEERERAQREERRRAELRRARRLLLIVSSAAVVCLTFGILAFRAEYEARGQRTIAQRKKLEAEVAQCRAEKALGKAESAAQKARIETIKREISQASSEFKISPTSGLLLAVDALNASRREELVCGQHVTCVQFAATVLVDLLDQTGGTPLIAHTKPVQALSFSGDGKILATADDETVNLWRVEQPHTSFAVLRPGFIGTVALSRDGKLLATAGRGVVKLFRTDQPQTELRPVSPWDMEDMGRISASFSGDGKFLLAASGMRSVSLWKLDHLEKPLANWGSDSLWVKFASFTSDGKFIVTVDAAGKVQQWQLNQLDGKPDPVLLGDLKSAAETVLFSGDGQHLLIPRQLKIAGLQRTARLIDLSNWQDEQPGGAPKETFGNPRSFGVATQDAALSADGGLAAIAADDGTVQIWRAKSPNEDPLKLRGHKGPVYAVAFSADGKLVATAGKDQTVRLWRVDQPFAISPDRKSGNWSTNVGLQKLIQLAAKTAGRNFTCKEWKEFFPDEAYRSPFPELPSLKIEKCE